MAGIIGGLLARNAYLKHQRDAFRIMGLSQAYEQMAQLRHLQGRAEGQLYANSFFKPKKS